MWFGMSIIVEAFKITEILYNQFILSIDIPVTVFGMWKSENDC